MKTGLQQETKGLGAGQSHRDGDGSAETLSQMQRSPDLPPGFAPLCSPGFQRGVSPRVPFTPHGVLGVQVRGFGSRTAGPQPRASAMRRRRLRRLQAASWIAGASGGCTQTEPAGVGPREGGAEESRPGCCSAPHSS